MKHRVVWKIVVASAFYAAMMLLPLRGSAADWTRFRGPNGGGRSDIAFNHPITAQDVLWKIQLPGIGHSSPVVQGNRVYITAGDRDSAKRMVLCIDANTGKTVWQRDFTSQTYRQHADNSYASATPAVDDLGVYVCWTTPEHYTLEALDLDGKDRWSLDLGCFQSQWGSGASPVIVGKLVILTADQEGGESFVVGVDRQTGKIAWKLPRKTGNKASTSTPCLFQPNDSLPQLILTNKATGITSINPATGTVNWELPNVLPMRAVGSPVTGDQLIVAGCGDGTTQREMVILSMAKPGQPPTIAYRLDKALATYVPTPLLNGDHLFLWADNGIVHCIKAATGKVIWSHRVTPGQFYGSPVLAGDTMWCMNRRGKLFGVSAADAFHLVGEFDLGEASHATPALADGHMYLRTISHLICIGNPAQSTMRQAQPAVSSRAD